MTNYLNRIRKLGERFDWHCVYCGRGVKHGDGDAKHKATTDHELPKCRGGKTEGSNIVLACMTCNNTKSDMTGAEFRSFLATGQIPLSYVEWLAERMRKQAGLHISKDIAAVEGS